MTACVRVYRHNHFRDSDLNHEEAIVRALSLGASEYLKCKSTELGIARDSRLHLERNEKA